VKESERFAALSSVKKIRQTRAVLGVYAETFERFEPATREDINLALTEEAWTWYVERAREIFPDYLCPYDGYSHYVSFVSCEYGRRSA
jgi:hypothetical protein